jgi:hypothetical protein
MHPAALSLLLALAAADLLPPVPQWQGASLSLIAAKNDPWITPSETDDFRTTPSYDQTVAWLRKLVAARPELHMLSLGKSPEGRDIWMVIASKEKAFTPEALRRSGKATVLAQGGIHSGEIDGKDAGMMLLRDLTVGGSRKGLLDRANLLFVPIFNVDGHERSSPYSRINQRGPENMGWRTNARNLNLNRDYAKLDSPEVRAMIRALNEWQPDLYLDLHVTDGVDYQYDINFGSESLPYAHSPAITRWLTQRFDPHATNLLRSMGHIPGPLIFAKNDIDYAGGIGGGASKIRFSTAYGDARHVPTILLETHSLKPYRQRVLGTYLFIVSALEAAGSGVQELRQAIASDRARRPEKLVLAWEEAPERDSLRIEAVESRRVVSPVTGSTVVEWTGKPVSMDVAVVRSRPAATVARAKAYWIPPAWPEVIERLAIHGIRMERIDAPRTVDVEMYRLSDFKVQELFEGRAPVTATAVAERRKETFAPGSVRVSADQPLGDLAALLLEPASPDSFFQWGFFLEVLQQTEYAEGYVMEPLARRMLEQDPKLAEEFRKKLESDAAFRGDPAARLLWFYNRTPYTDPRWKLYPVGRE